MSSILEQLRAAISEPNMGRADPSRGEHVQATAQLVPTRTWTGPYIRPEMILLAQLRTRTPPMKPVDCSYELGLSRATVNSWLRHPLYRMYEMWLLAPSGEALRIEETVRQQGLPSYPRGEEAPASLKARLQDDAYEMTERLLAIAEATNDGKLAANIYQDLLDRAGVAKVQERRVSTVLNINDAKLAELFSRANEIGSPIVEGEVVPSKS